MKKLQHKKVIIRNCSESNDDFTRLYYIFRLTLRPGMSFRQFTFYYYSTKLEYIDVTFLYDENLIVGFCAAAFYSSVSNGKATTLGRSATGFIENYQGKSLPKWTLYYKYIRYKKLHPFTPLILTAYVANPLVYSMICKYTGIVYPRRTLQVDEKITRLKEEVLDSSGLRSRESNPFAVKIHFDVQKGENLLQRITESKDEHVQFFLKNIGIKPQITMLVIIPVSWLNIALTSYRFTYYQLSKLYFVCLLFMYQYIMECKKNLVKISGLPAKYG